jgi:hypothetical protein
MSMTLRNPSFSTLWLTVLAITLLGAGSARAALVSASYEGVIDSDSGIGLIGQTMRFDFTYDDSVVGSPSGSGFFYSGYVVSATITIGSDVWTWNNGGSFAFLNNDDVIVFSIGVEDRVNFSSSDYVGPDLGLGTTNSSSRSFSVFLSDNVPTGAPDGLSDDAVLPNPAPDPALFQTSPTATTGLSFSWVVGDPETGTFYDVSTSEVIVAADTVPIPGWLAPILAVAMASTALVFLQRKGARARS